MIAPGSPVFTDYSNYENPPNITRVESFFILHNYDSCVYNWAHVPGKAEDKITVLVRSQQYPSFMTDRYFFHFKDLQDKYPGLKVMHEPDAFNLHA